MASVWLPILRIDIEQQLPCGAWDVMILLIFSDVLVGSHRPPLRYILYA
jgi:hypothetical protein